MPKVAKREPKNIERYLKELYKVLSATDPKETERLLEDLLTPTETKMLAKRIQVAKMLLTGSTYDEIERALNVQRNTIARIQLNLTRSPSQSLEKAIVIKLPH